MIGRRDFGVILSGPLYGRATNGELRYAHLVNNQSVIYEFWGKARPQDADRGPRHHPLAFHCLDVAAVGRAVLMRHHALHRHFASLLRLSPADTDGLLTYLLCLHDIGKFAKKFQAKAREHFPACFNENPERISTSYDHGAGGLRLFESCPEALIPGGRSHHRSWRPLISATTGHHGAPPSLNPIVRDLRQDFGGQGINAAGEFAAAVRDVLPWPSRIPDEALANTKRTSFAVAGLAVLADWIGSKQTWFPYRRLDDFADLHSYWRCACECAERAVEEADIPPTPAAAFLAPSALIGPGAKPTPMQEWAQLVELPDGPALFVVEDETGSGKTEAAMMLAHRLMAEGRADGLYVALPTMATANAMFDRLADALGSLFAAGKKPSMALAHGSRELHPRFRAAMPARHVSEKPYPGGTADAADTTASSACAEWIADDRRKAFLADAGAGTIDQALLSVLPSRHQSLRLLGLMRRVLILDEVHAYDAYMQREMETLLTFQAGLGGSAILLSATLPSGMRSRLTDAFAAGLESVDGSGEVGDAGYPLATVRSVDRAVATKVPVREGGGRSLPVRTLRSPGDALDELENAARSGKAALYIRNTVDDALEAYDELVKRGLDVDLFHARFALIDRLDIEQRVVQTFGKHSTPDQRQGKVLVATQIVEQSLDLDFDVLVTDLAPIDLIIQRAGRLWRHRWRERKGQPELVVVGPEPVSNAESDWFSKAFRRAAMVYANHAHLWLTAKVLEEKGKIDSPAGLRSLIEAVYGTDAECGLPKDLRASFNEGQGKDWAERGIANTATLKFSTGYLWDGGAWENDVKAVTRLDDDPSVVLRLGRLSGERVEAYGRKGDSEDWAAWRLSEVRVPKRLASAEDASSSHADAIQATKASWTRFDQDSVLVALNEDAEGRLVGATMKGDGGERVSLRYNPNRGLSFDAEAP